ncbi:hypothetical protein KIN20_016279 [Parelaphostrongylus tenuis]|uniref:Uncharacterized protein n=1 Tax=Parelaphostrongylus tenuis TaxID=148309 RepID=A0AAD5MG77_PARTN|nr:hypothetical protein KIN20_016279 [Parelaphostrongylus tenuis]
MNDNIMCSIVEVTLKDERHWSRHGRTDTQRRYAGNWPTTTTVERLQLARAAV